MEIDKKLILNKLKQYKNFASDAEFARYIGVSPTVLSNWFRRNTFNIDKIVNVFPEIKKSWLLTGEGEMINAPKNSFSQMTEEQIGNIATETFAERLMKAYESGEIYPASVHNRIVAEKDKRIEELQRQNWELQKKLNDMSGQNI